MKKRMTLVMLMFAMLACNGGPAVDVAPQGTPGMFLTQQASSGGTSPCNTLGADTVAAIFGVAVTIETTEGSTHCFYQFEDSSALTISINELADTAQENLTNSGEGEEFVIDGLDAGQWVEQNRTYFGRRGSVVIGISGSGSFSDEGPPLQEKMATLAVALMDALE